MVKFGVGRTYPRLAWRYKVVKRTPCYLTLEWESTSPWGNVSTKSKRVKLHSDDGYEYVMLPNMDCFDLRATDTKDLA